MSANKKHARGLPGELERLSESIESGNLGVTMNLSGMPGKDLKTARLVNRLLDAYRASMEYDLMKYKLTSNALGVALWDMDVIDGDPVNPNNRFTWSQEARHMLRFSDERDFPNILSSWSDRLHPEDKAKTLDAFAAHLNDYTGGTSYNIEYRVKKKTGEYIWLKADGSTMRSPSGVLIRVVGSVEDISSRLHKEELEKFISGFTAEIKDMTQSMAKIAVLIVIRLPDAKNLYFVNVSEFVVMNTRSIAKPLYPKPSG